MRQLFTFLKNIFSSLTSILQSQYKWMLIAFILWLYRIEYIPADSGGFAKLLQITSLGVMFFYLLKFSRYKKLRPLTTSINSLKFITLLYIWATISFLWSPMPQFAFFLGFQNIVLLLILYWLFSIQPDKTSVERVFLQSFLLLNIINSILFRLIGVPSLFAHHLGAASSSALLLTYSFGELLNAPHITSQRKRLLKYTICISAVILIFATSSGANISAILGISVALFFSRKWIYSFLLLIIGGVLFFNQDLINSLILAIMPGKNWEVIESATGRDTLWEGMLMLAEQRPFTGWGFGCIERIAWEYNLIPFPIPDAHSNYVGIYGSLGIIGFCLFLVHLICLLFLSLCRRKQFGHLGIVAAITCATLNGYTYGFLASKASIITLTYFSLVILQYCFIKKRINAFPKIK